MSGRRAARTSLPTDVRAVARGFRWGRRPPAPTGTRAGVVEPGPAEFPTGWSRRPGAVLAREVVQTVAFGPLVRSQTRLSVQGLDRLDGLDGLDGPCVFAANHASHLDAPLVVLSLPPEVRRRTAVTAAADYFFDAWWRAAGTALLLNTVPMERMSGRVSSTPARLLDEGWNLVVFPEGTRSVDGWSGPLRGGAAHLAVGAGVPVVPVSLRGTYAAMPRGRTWPTPGRPPLEVRFGAPLHPGDRSPRELTAALASSVALLHDETDSDWWSAQRRAARGETPSLAGPDVAPWRRRFEATRPRPSAVARPRAWGG